MTAKQCVEVELVELKTKLESLSKLLQGDKPDFISDIQWELMIEQEFHMLEYAHILEERLKEW